MNTSVKAYRSIYQALVLCLVTFWFGHWIGQSPGDNVDTGPWVAAGIFLMLGKTLPLWLFLFLIKPGQIKSVNYLSFATLFYLIVAIWNLMSGLWIGLLQLLATGWLFWLTLKLGYVVKQAAKQKKTQDGSA